MKALENLVVTDLVHILQYVSEQYQIRANDAGMDYGGEYEYTEWMKLKEDLDTTIKRLKDIDNLWIDQIPIHFQICKIHNQQPLFDLPVIKDALEFYYNLQNEEFQKVKKQMELVRYMTKYLEKSEQYV